MNTVRAVRGITRRTRKPRPPMMTVSSRFRRKPAMEKIKAFL